MTFEDPKTSFLLSAFNECGLLNLTVMYSRFNVATVATESQLLPMEISAFPFWMIAALLLLAVLLVFLFFFFFFLDLT
jgi:hypothetical protein